MKKTAFLVTIQPSTPAEKPEMRVYSTAEDLCAFLKNSGKTVIVSEVTVHE